MLAYADLVFTHLTFTGWKPVRTSVVAAGLRRGDRKKCFLLRPFCEYTKTGYPILARQCSLALRPCYRWRENAGTRPMLRKRSHTANGAKR
jgi:hypothetical protein